MSARDGSTRPGPIPGLAEARAVLYGFTLAGQAAPLLAGHCTPLHGPGEGLQLLVLGGQALAELCQAMADHAASVAAYEQRRADPERLRELRGG